MSRNVKKKKKKKIKTFCEFLFFFFFIFIFFFSKMSKTESYWVIDIKISAYESADGSIPRWIMSGLSCFLLLLHCGHMF